MKFFKSATNIIFLAVIFICVAAIIFLSSVIIEKNGNIASLETRAATLESEISQNLADIEAANKKIAEIDAELKKINEETAEIRSEYASLKSQKETLEKEKAKLQEENSTLKSSIEELSVAHQAKAQKAAAQSAAKGQKICYLTFDDGPSENTLEVLEILDKYDVRATFFVMNTNKIGYLRNIHKAGHTIGLHTSTHDYSKLYKSTTAYFADLKEISDTVEDITGIKSKIIRFPGGSSNKISEDYSKGIMPKLIKQVAEKGYFYFDWNVDSLDASGNNVSYTKIRDSVLTAAAKKESICVLMHDTDAKDSTVTALPEIIEGLKKQGYIFKPLLESSYGYHHNIK